MSDQRQIHDAIMAYLLVLELLPRLDKLNASRSLIKATRTMEGFATESFKNIEKHQGLADIINNDMVQQFSKLVDNFQLIQIQ